MSYCPKCGNKVAEADLYCSACGTRLEQVEPTQEKAPVVSTEERRGLMTSDKIAFPWYVGQALASLLPYRKKGLIFGSRVCEWAAVLTMAKAAFFVGCSLALVNRSAAEDILTESAASDALQNRGQPWRIAFSEPIQQLESRRKQSELVDPMTFENLYPELASNRFKALLLTPEQCAKMVGKSVIPGLICGLLFPETASPMLETWVTQERKWKDVGVGGLRVDEAPLLTSVEEACRHTLSLYEAWQRQ